MHHVQAVLAGLERPLLCSSVHVKAGAGGGTHCVLLGLPPFGACFTASRPPSGRVARVCRQCWRAWSGRCCAAAAMWGLARAEGHTACCWGFHRTELALLQVARRQGALPACAGGPGAAAAVQQRACGGRRGRRDTLHFAVAMSCGVCSTAFC